VGKYLVLSVLFIASAFVSAQSPARKAAMLITLSHRHDTPNFATNSARLHNNINVERAYREIDTLLTTGHGDMFWMYAATGFYFSTQDVLRPEYKIKLREAWKRLTPYRGDTENHFLMYYGSLFLMSQEWPNLPGSEWFTGQSSQEIQKQSREYLEHWVDEIVRVGQVEFDSPRYSYYFITPLFLLAEYTKDPYLKQRFSMVLEMFLADYAIEYLHGSYCGAYSRSGDYSVINPRVCETRGYGDFMFEDSSTYYEPDIAFLALSKYECPEVIRLMARTRNIPYEHFERKQGRRTLRYSDVRNEDVYKVSYMTDDYCLGSMQGGLVQPIQQHSWSIITNSTVANNTIFGLHPYISPKELGMFFPEEPEFMIEKIGSVKAGYPSENKWVGGSPYEKIVQKKNVLLASYAIPQDAQSKHVDLYTPLRSKMSAVVLTEDGYYFFVELDSVLVGITGTGRPEVSEDGVARRVRIYGDTLAYGVAITSNASNFSKFRQDFESAQLIQKKGEFTFTFDETILSSEAKPTKLQKQYLFYSSMIQSKYGSGIITMQVGGKKRILDFNSNAVRER